MDRSGIRRQAKLLLPHRFRQRRFGGLWGEAGEGDAVHDSPGEKQCWSQEENRDPPECPSGPSPKEQTAEAEKAAEHASKEEGTLARSPISCGFCLGAGVAQWLEHQPSKLRVAGSNPVSRSKATRTSGSEQEHGASTTFARWRDRLDGLQMDGNRRLGFAGRGFRLIS